MLPARMVSTKNHHTAKRPLVKNASSNLIGQTREKPSNFTMKLTEFRPPHLHTQERFENHHHDNCAGCQLAEKLKREDAEARGVKYNSNSRSPPGRRGHGHGAHGVEDSRSNPRMQTHQNSSPKRNRHQQYQSMQGDPNRLGLNNSLSTSPEQRNGHASSRSTQLKKAKFQKSKSNSKSPP